MENQSKIIIGLILCLMSICNISCGQSKKGITNEDNNNRETVNDNLPCIDSILQVKNEFKANVCLSTDIEMYGELIKNHEYVNKWLANINRDELCVYSINNNTNKYLIFSSTMVNATGLATSFYHWLLINIDKRLVFKEKLSLSRDSRSWFIKNNKVHFITFEYGDEFYHGDRNYTKLPITAIEYILSGDSLVKASSLDIVCSGD